MLFDWLSIHTDGIRVVWATRQSNWKPGVDNGLNNLSGFLWRFRRGCLAVVSDDAFLLRQFLQRLPKRLHRSRCPVDGNASVSHYSYFQGGLFWVLLSRTESHRSQKQKNTEKRS